jgi:hypothetical protein
LTCDMKDNRLDFIRVISFFIIYYKKSSFILTYLMFLSEPNFSHLQNENKKLSWCKIKPMCENDEARAIIGMIFTLLREKPYRS